MPAADPTGCPKNDDARHHGALDRLDTGAVDGLTGAMRDKKESVAFKGHSRHDLIAGGNIRLVGSAEQIVDWFLRLKAAGCDGVRLSVFDFEPELDFVGARMQPPMEQAGLRLPVARARLLSERQGWPRVGG